MSPAGDGVHLRIGDPLGLMSRGLTARSPGVVDDHASRSPDGWLVLFERTTDHGSDIGIVHIAEPGVVTIVDTGCRTTPDCAGAVGPTWSFDGSRVLFTRVMAPIDGSGEAASAALYSVKLDGSDLQRVSSPALAQGTGRGAAKFSPAGRVRVFLREHERRRRAEVRDLQERRGRLPCAADDAVGHRRRPALHLTGPIRDDGRTGVFDVSDDSSVGSRDVALMPLACDRIDECTRWTRYLTHDHPGPWSAFGVSWSPDGRSLSYAVETARGATGRPSGHRHGMAPGRTP